MKSILHGITLLNSHIYLFFANRRNSFLVDFFFLLLQFILLWMDSSYIKGIRIWNCTLVIRRWQSLSKKFIAKKYRAITEKFYCNLRIIWDATGFLGIICWQLRKIVKYWELKFNGQIIFEIGNEKSSHSVVWFSVLFCNSKSKHWQNLA